MIRTQVIAVLGRSALGMVLLLCMNGPLYAVDVVIDINQARALAGGVTPGDTPGFPVTISQSGSYRLTGNLTVADLATTGISVVSDNVTIDLNGFSSLGPVVCTNGGSDCTQGTGEGIGIDGRSNLGITVRNGVVQGMGGNGILLGGRARVEGVTAVSNRGYGINIRPQSNSFLGGGVAINCIAEENGIGGIHVSIATGCVADLNATSSQLEAFGNTGQNYCNGEFGEQHCP